MCLYDVADDLLSLAVDVMPQCCGRLLASDVSRADRVTRIIETLTMNGAVLVPYPLRSVLADEFVYFTVCCEVISHNNEQDRTESEAH